jgi:hypothetical protein
VDDYKNEPSQFEDKISDDAKALFKKIKEVNLDESLTFRATCEKTNEIIDNASEAVKKELKYLKKNDCSKNIVDQFSGSQQN